MENYLYHHGVKGMKWGVRRYQNKNGRLTTAGRRRHDSDGGMTEKAAKKWYKKNQAEMINKKIKYGEEYDNTEEGKQKKQAYQKAIQDMYKDENWNENKQKDFSKKEESYLRSQGEYAAKKLIEEYGEEKAAIYANRGRINTGKDAIEALSDEWWIHAV